MYWGHHGDIALIYVCEVRAENRPWINFGRNYITRRKKFAETKGVIRIPKSKDRQHNGQKKKDNDLLNTTKKLKIKQHKSKKKNLGWTWVFR